MSRGSVSGIHGSGLISEFHAASASVGLGKSVYERMPCCEAGLINLNNSINFKRLGMQGLFYGPLTLLIRFASEDRA
jgi:hypothetical protein